jgi:hypothetical protein
LECFYQSFFVFEKNHLVRKPTTTRTPGILLVKMGRGTWVTTKNNLPQQKPTDRCPADIGTNPEQKNKKQQRNNNKNTPLVKKLVREAKVEPRYLDQWADPQHGHASGKAPGPPNLRSDPGWTWEFFFKAR